MEGRIERAQSAQGGRATRQDPSFYYSRNLEIMSMKEFIVFLEESKRRQHQEERARLRVRERELVSEVGRSIQSSHSRRNLRLTSSSASRIATRIRHKQYQGLYDPA